MSPFAKTGGLADVAGSLPGALKKLGVQVMVGLPYYRIVRENGVKTETALTGLEVAVNGKNLSCNVLNALSEDNGHVFFIDRNEFFDRPDLYATPTGDYPDNLERFSFFNLAALLFAKTIGFDFHVVHCHDWQTGLVPAFLRTRYAKDPFFSHAASVFTIHNMGYQGLFSPELFPATGLPPGEFNPAGVEYWGNISLLKAGIQYSDAITTVSPTYSREIQTSEYGMGMEGLLEHRGEDLHGILNGVDYKGWDPATDQYLTNHYSVKDMKGKGQCKADLVKALQLDDSVLSRPLLAVISRLTVQKGYDLLLEVMEEVLKLDTGIVVLAAGEIKYQRPLDELARKHPSRIAIRIGFDEPLAHRIMAGADMLLVPSRYEPCGLTQIYALKYGTVPIVRATGGLDDTIRQFDPSSKKGTGFKFVEFESQAFLNQIRAAVETFNHEDSWRTIVQNGMMADFSWEESAQKYVSLFSKLSRNKKTKGV